MEWLKLSAVCSFLFAILLIRYFNRKDKQKNVDWEKQLENIRNDASKLNIDDAIKRSNARYASRRGETDDD